MGTPSSTWWHSCFGRAASWSAGDRVIVPPPKTVADAAKRLGTHEGYDWWFCHRPLEKR